jgi:hypothetical protein
MPQTSLHTAHMPKVKSSSRSQSKPLVEGQVWRMAEMNLQVGLVGKLLVHYKLAKPDAVRVSNSVSGIAAVEKFLKKNKAVLKRKDKAAPVKAKAKLVHA